MLQPSVSSNLTFSASKLNNYGEIQHGAHREEAIVMLECAFCHKGVGSSPALPNPLPQPIIHYGVTLKTITASKFRAQFSDLLQDLDSGPVEVTKHGTVVAVLSSPHSPVEVEADQSMTIDPYEQPEPPTSPSEPLETMSVEDEEESEEWSEDEERLFEAYLSSQDAEHSSIH